MASPRFSVVIPTREGVSTLAATLRTCLDQEFDDYEIVVCDNFSSPATREVVDGFASPRIKNLRSPRPLAMSSNWELAVAHAAGDSNHSAIGRIGQGTLRSREGAQRGRA